MPMQDKTGPMGEGPRTGRGMGPCGVGMGWRRGWGNGYGKKFWNWFQRSYRDMDKNEKKEMLEAEIEGLQTELEEAKKELSNME